MRFRRGVLIIIMVMLSLAIVACASSPATSKPIQSSPAATSSQASAAAATQGNTVSIENFAFVPDSLTIKAGTTVIWTNNDSASHNIKSTDFTSPMMANGQTFEFKFDTKGTFDYICGVHPSMKGKIIVE